MKEGGIFIANLQVQPANHIYIRATLQQTHSGGSGTARDEMLSSFFLFIFSIAGAASQLQGPF
jgi:hypothetical protein